MSSQTRSSGETSTHTNSSPYVVLKTDAPAKKWTPEENDRFLNMIDNVVSHDVWSTAKEEEKLANRSNGDKKSWIDIFKKKSSKP